MHVGEVMTADVANGEGMRVSVFVSGCRNHCKGCFQPQTWDFNYGREYTPEIEQFIIDELSKSYYDGITILGGDPMEPENQEPVLRLLRRIKKELPDKNVWVYTGYVYDRDLVPGGKRFVDGVTRELLESIDILIDGRFVEELKNLMLNFRGSGNQRIIKMKETLETGKVVLSELNN
ncbi:MAG: anaerobic ribonucleoside-triphosphate reductase activating protein [Clostridia bacterium]|nr:anaerobic ribonucleoside-triphosphate reductase activating protein [Lachnospiraceae bacterium]MEE0284160.1 anaerobic ribonucleoside-triphosphate reductase activating protein [Lachnospiraceae bacterium]